MIYQILIAVVNFNIFSYEPKKLFWFMFLAHTYLFNNSSVEENNQAKWNNLLMIWMIKTVREINLNIFMCSPSAQSLSVN